MSEAFLVAALFIVRAEGAALPLWCLFKLEVVVFYGAVLFVRKRIDFKEIQRFDEGNEFLVPEVTDVEVGELFAQEIPQGAGENPAVVVGVFFGQFDEGLADG